MRKRRFQSFNKAYLQKTELSTGVYGRRNYPSPSNSDGESESASPTPYKRGEAKYSDSDSAEEKYDDSGEGKGWD